MAGTVLKLGWSDPLTGAFGAHPTLGPVLDLDDGVTFTLAGPDAVVLEAPERTLVVAGNIRTQGERGTRGIYRHNRRLAARVNLGPMASAADLVANVRALVAWLSASPAIPITLQYQPLGASAPVYLDVVGAAHDIPSDEGEWLRLQLEAIELVFVVRPGLRGDRVTLSNLAANPGFEAPSGPAVVVFSDAFANANAYSLVAGSPPTVSANIMTLPGGTYLTFGSPAWGAVNRWQVRFFASSSSSCYFHLHYSDANNSLRVDINPTQQFIVHNVGGSAHILASATYTMVNNAWYWLSVTQFPTVPGDPPDVQASLQADASGVPSTTFWTLGPVPTYDAITALAGRSVLQAGSAALSIGGSYSGVHTVALFGPGGWGYSETNGGTAISPGAWEQGTANTYSAGPVASFGAARIDLAPAGTVGAFWESYSGGAPSGSSAIAVSAAGNVVAASCVARSNGLSAGAQITLQLREWDASGAFLRATTLQTIAGNQPAWTTLAGTATTGASCAYVSALLWAQDLSAAGESANGTIWFDNVQVWNQTTTGATTMPYCELRFPQSPAQLVVSGVLGDLPAPAYLALGTYLASWATGATLNLALGRRAHVSANAQLAAASNGFYGTAFSLQATAALDATSYGGYYAQAQVTSAGWNPRAFSPHPADAQGTYHLIERHLSKQSAPNLANVQVRVVAQQLGDAWYGNPNGTDQLGAYTGAWAAPLASSTAWTVVDAGQVTIPPLSAGALTDLTQTYVTPRPQWTDATGGGAVQQANWQMLLPVDGALLMGVLNNPSNAPFAVMGQWLWSYVDALAVASGGAAAWTYSVEAAPLPNPAHAGGGPGTQSTGAININAGVDPYLTLDPGQQFAGNGGVNQLVAYIADGTAAVLPLAAEIQYAPLYLWPR